MPSSNMKQNTNKELRKIRNNINSASLLKMDPETKQKSSRLIWQPLRNNNNNNNNVCEQ